MGSQEPSPRSDLRLVLVGSEKVGKSSAGNTILGKKEFDCQINMAPLTKTSEIIEGYVEGYRVSVVDTPGLCNSWMSEEQVKVQLLRAVELSSPGPHIFLLVVQLGRFTKQERKVLETLKKMLGANVSKHTMVLFTYGDRLEDSDIKEVIREDRNLQNLLTNCSNQYHVFNNKQTRDRSQVRELLGKIVEISERGGSYYERSSDFAWPHEGRSYLLAWPDTFLRRASRWITYHLPDRNRSARKEEAMFKTLKKIFQTVCCAGVGAVVVGAVGAITAVICGASIAHGAKVGAAVGAVLGAVVRLIRRSAP